MAHRLQNRRDESKNRASGDVGAGAGSGSFVRKAGGWSYSGKGGETGTAGEEAELTNAAKNGDAKLAHISLTDTGPV